MDLDVEVDVYIEAVILNWELWTNVMVSDFNFWCAVGFGLGCQFRIGYGRGFKTRLSVDFFRRIGFGCGSGCEFKLECGRGFNYHLWS